MSNLSLKLDDEEDNKIEVLKVLLNTKTTNGVLRHLIKNYKLISDRKDELIIDLENKDDEYRELKYCSNNYFKSMHDLMKISDYEHKL